MPRRAIVQICCLLGLVLSAPGHARASALSYPIIFSDNRVFADVGINGQGPFAFILDTGSSSTTIDNTLMKRLALKPIGSGQAGGAGEHMVDFATVHLKAVTLGPITEPTLYLGAMNVPAIDGQPLAAVVGFQRFDGVLGAEIFTHHVVTIDIGQGRLTVERPDRFKPASTAIRVPLILNEDLMPVIDGSIAGIAGRFLVDTGDRSSLTLFAPFWQAHGLDAQLGQTVTAMTGYGVGGPIQGIVGRPAGFTLGGVAVPPPVTRLSLQKAGAFASTDYAGSIGMGILRRFIVSFDYTHHAMWLTKAPDFDAPDLYDRAGLWLAFGEDGQLTVLDLIAHCPAAEAGVRRGDVVAAIDDNPASRDTLFQLRALLRKPGRAQATITVIRDGKPTPLSIALRDLISPQH